MKNFTRNSSTQIMFVAMLIFFKLTISIAQVPQSIPYQAIARDNTGSLIVNHVISLRFSIHDISTGGTVIYKETQSTTTNSLGLFTVSIGQGTVVTGIFSSINWGINSKFMQFEMDISGGSSYITIGTQQLLSVPYALYSENSKNGWNILGNSAINSSTNFIGTTDGQPLKFRISNIAAGELNPTTNNSFFGLRAGFSNTTGYSNSGFGIGALNINTLGHNLVAFGDSALYNQSVDPNDFYSNTALGSKSLFTNTTGGFNTASGFQSLYSNTTGYSNSASGYKALYSNTEGFWNSSFGNNSMAANTEGNGNTAMGTNALYLNNSGSFNTSIGSFSLRQNISGSENTMTGYNSGYFNTASANSFYGSQSGYQNTTGNSNSFFGKNSGRLNQIGNYNSFFGFEAGYNNNASGNSFFGFHSGYQNLTGYNNCFIGQEAGALTNTGYGNCFMGYSAGFNNTGGYSSVAIGEYSLYTNSTGYWNTAVGYNSLQFNTSGIENTAIGAYCMINNTTGIWNTGVGLGAGGGTTTGGGNTSIGVAAMGSNSLGSWNTSCGYYALSGTTGGGNTALGSNSISVNVSGFNITGIGYNSNVSTNALGNATAIGSGAIVNSSNKIRLGNSTTSVVEGQVAYSYPSDGRFKYNITENVIGLDFINRLRPVIYNFDTRKFDNFLMKNMPDSIRLSNMEKQDYSNSSNLRQSGFIAQEVEMAENESGYDFNGLHKPIDENDNYSLSYSQFVVPLVKAVQELSTKNNLLEENIENLKTIISQMNFQIEYLKADHSKHAKP